jgi:hypothetical protein
MNPTGALLKIIYEGVPVRVEPEDITETMRVPKLGIGGPQRPDVLPAEIALRLFSHAVVEGALVVPRCLVVVPYSYDTSSRHELMLLACPGPEPRVGVTQGWFPVEQLARDASDTRGDSDPGVVREALEVMAENINAALRG